MGRTNIELDEEILKEALNEFKEKAITLCKTLLSYLKYYHEESKFRI